MGDGDEADEREAYLNLVRTHERLNRDLARFFEERGTTHQQYRVLSVLFAHDGDEGLSCQEIGERMVNHVPDVTRLLDRLEKAGLVQRARCKRDRRVVRSRLTSKGKSLVETTEKPLAEAQRSLLGGLTEGELRTLRLLLEKTSSDSGD
jgi:DNA-binding MarR family transcriptional regulator